MNRASFFRLLLPLCASSAIAVPAAATGSLTFHKMVVQGEPAPGTESGTVFAHPFSYIPVVPFLDEEGRMTFTLPLSGPSITAANGTGIWSGVPGSIDLVARAGSQAPGTPAGTVFRGFIESFELVSPDIGSGRLAFTASLTGTGVTAANNAGVWAGEAGNFALLARTGSPAPGTPAGTLFTELFLSGGGASGAALVRGRVNGPGITTENDEGFWTDRGGSLALLVREGNPAPGVGGLVFGGAGEFIGTGYTFQATNFSDGSSFSGQANLTGTGVDEFNNEALWREVNGNLVLLAREGGPAPGAGHHVTFAGNGVTSGFGDVSLNELGQAAFTTYLGGSVETQSAMFSDHEGSLAPLVMPGDPAPGTNDDFGVFGYPLLSDGGRVAFRCALASSGMWPPFGIWWDAQTLGSLVPLVLPGAALPGSPGTTILGTNFLYGFNASNQLTFSASLDDAVQGFREALFFAQPNGSYEVVVQGGEMFDVHGNGSELREVESFLFGALNDAGMMAIRIDFTDGTFGIYAVTPNATTDVVADAGRIARFALEPTSPNPFRKETFVRFALPVSGRVTVDVVDVAGRLVSRILDEPREVGRHAVSWNGLNQEGGIAPSGVYFLKATSDVGSATGKIVKLD